MSRCLPRCLVICMANCATRSSCSGPTASPPTVQREMLSRSLRLQRRLCRPGSSSAGGGPRLVCTQGAILERSRPIRGNHEFREQNIAMGVRIRHRGAGAIRAARCSGRRRRRGWHRGQCGGRLADAGAVHQQQQQAWAAPSNITKRVFASVHSVFDCFPSYRSSVGRRHGTGASATATGDLNSSPRRCQGHSCLSGRAAARGSSAVVGPVRPRCADGVGCAPQHAARPQPQLSASHEALWPRRDRGLLCPRRIQLIIRSHQYVEEGVNHALRTTCHCLLGTQLPRTVKNDGALLLIAIDGHGHAACAKASCTCVRRTRTRIFSDAQGTC